VRVLHILPSLDERSGGPLRAVLDLSFFAQAYGLESEVVGIGEVDVQDNLLQSSLIHSCHGDWFRSYSYSPRLRTWLHKNVKRFDGVVLHGMWLYPNLAAAQECIRFGVPYACFPHGMLDPWAVGGQGWWKCIKKHVYWHLAEKMVFYNAEGALFATKREYALARNAFSFLCLSSILPVFGADRTVETVTMSPSDRVLKAAASRYVLFLGRIHPKKNLEFLFRSWAQAKVQAGWRLVIAGPGEDGYLAALNRMTKSLEIDDDVTFVDFVSGDDKKYLLKNAQWLILPSKQENFGIVVLEALQHGCPVAISDQVFLADELGNGVVTLKLRMDEWIQFFSGKMVDESYRRSRVERGRELLFCNYSFQFIAELWTIAFGALFCQRRAH
jgi:glycosyltransferase involved in cell wall biosynthesis